MEMTTAGNPLRRTPEEKEQQHINRQAKYIDSLVGDLDDLHELRLGVIQEGNQKQQERIRNVQYHKNRIEELDRKFQKERDALKERQDAYNERIAKKEQQIKEAQTLLDEMKNRAE